MDLAERNYHLKLLEMCDCYMETDFLAELRALVKEKNEDLDEGAIKFLSLGIMYAVTKQARKLSFKKKGEHVSVIVKNDDKEALPSPPLPLYEKIDEIMRAILHLEEDKGGMPLSLGLRNGQMELQVKMERKKDKKSLKIKFPGQE